MDKYSLFDEILYQYDNDTLDTFLESLFNHFENTNYEDEMFDVFCEMYNEMESECEYLQEDVNLEPLDEELFLEMGNIFSYIKDRAAGRVGSRLVGAVKTHNALKQARQLTKAEEKAVNAAEKDQHKALKKNNSFFNRMKTRHKMTKEHKTAVANAKAKAKQIAKAKATGATAVRGDNGEEIKIDDAEKKAKEALNKSTEDLKNYKKNINTEVANAVTKNAENIKKESESKIKDAENKLKEQQKKADEYLSKKSEELINQGHVDSVTSERTFNKRNKIAQIGIVNKKEPEEKKEVESTPKPEINQADVIKNKFGSGVNSDFELYKILDFNGYKPTNENLAILKECLKNNSAIILSAKDINITEETSKEDFIEQLLENNGYKVNEKNINILKEALSKQQVLFEDKDSVGIKKKTLKTIGKVIAGAALGGVLGYGAGAAADAIKKKVSTDNADKLVADTSSKLSDAELKQAEAKTELDAAKDELKSSVNDPDKLDDATDKYADAKNKHDNAVKEFETATANKETALKNQQETPVRNDESGKYIKGISTAAGAATGAAAVGTVEAVKNKKKKKTEDNK